MVKSQTLCYTTPRRCGMRKLSDEERIAAKKKFDEYNLQYKKENYSQIAIRLPKGYRERLNELAKAKGTTTAMLIKNFIDENIPQ